MSKPVVTNLADTREFIQVGRIEEMGCRLCWLLISFVLAKIYSFTLEINDLRNLSFVLLFPDRVCSVMSKTFKPASAQLTW